jgi:hypothetical protein
MFSIAAGIGIFAGFFSFVIGIIERTSRETDTDAAEIRQFFEAIDLEAWILPLIFIGILGIGLWVLSLFLSARILRGAGHPAPWGVTWAGAGIAIVASWFLSWIAWLPLQIISFPGVGNSWEATAGIGAVLGGLGVLVNIAITVVIGWLSWWWMAHLQRPAE